MTSASFHFVFFFFFTNPAPTVIYTLSLHDALPICSISFARSGRHVETPRRIDIHRLRHLLRFRQSIRVPESSGLHGRLRLLQFRLRIGQRIRRRHRLGEFLQLRSLDQLLNHRLRRHRPLEHGLDYLRLWRLHWLHLRHFHRFWPRPHHRLRHWLGTPEISLRRRNLRHQVLTCIRHLFGNNEGKDPDDEHQDAYLDSKSRAKRTPAPLPGWKDRVGE